MILYESLLFQSNWNNKLSCSSFTTFRLHNPRKYQVGKRLSVMIQGKHLKDIEILAVKVMKLHQVNEFVARIDTGYSQSEFIKIVETMYKNKGIDFEKADWDLVLCHEIKSDKKVAYQTAQASLSL